MPAKKTTTPATKGKGEKSSPNYEYKSGGPNLEKLNPAVDFIEGVAIASFKTFGRSR